MALPVDYDVVIVGGGIVGLTLACLLGRTSLRLAIVEVRLPVMQGPDEGEFDQRVSAITRASEYILATAGAWEEIACRRLFPFREMRVWDATGNGVIHFDSADIGEDRLGYIIENRVIESALLDRVRSLDDVVLYRPAEIKAIALSPGHVSLTLRGGERITTRLVVGADGADSKVRQMAGIRTLQWSYGQQAIVTQVKTSEPHWDTAWQVFLPTGPLAFLPLSDHDSSIVWSTATARAGYLMALDEDGFLAELQTAFGTALGRMLSVGPRAAYPLRALYATSSVQPRIALAGDAAHTIHPLAGQGVNLGLLDAAALAQVLTQGVAQGRDPGGLPLLRRYERWRKGDHLIMLATMEGFHRLFGLPFAPARWVRNWGLNLTHMLTPVKNLLMRQAMGIEGGMAAELPATARGPAFRPTGV